VGVFGEAEVGGPALPSGLRRRLALALGVVGLPLGDALLRVMTMADARLCIVFVGRCALAKGRLDKEQGEKSRLDSRQAAAAAGEEKQAQICV